MTDRSEPEAEAAEAARIERLIRPWFPTGCFVAAAPIEDRPLPAAEQAHVARAVERRRREFATGRWLARAGLRALGRPEVAIGVGALREPLWPDGIEGSISHDGDWCAVVLAARRPGSPVGLGLDTIAVPARRGRMADIAPMFVAHPHELDVAAGFDLPVEPEMVCFALKEAAIKAVRGRLRGFVDMRRIGLAQPGSPQPVTILGHPVAMRLNAGLAGDRLFAGAVLDARGAPAIFEDAT
jgi:4'-phosphopantetheinyl transferase EntD